MFEIREWVNERKRVMFGGLNLNQAFVVLKKLKAEEPEKVYSIYRSKENRKGGERHDYQAKEN